jgi:hypothetical protein
MTSKFIENENNQTVARYVEITGVKTYATKENALKAVDKLMKKYSMQKSTLDFTIMKNDDNRYFPLFFGERALQAGIHFHFNCCA